MRGARNGLVLAAKRWQQIAAGVSPQIESLGNREPRSGGSSCGLSVDSETDRGWTTVIVERVAWIEPRCRRFAAHAVCVSLFRGLTPTAICWRRFATQEMK